jgi:hypothetical protein
MGLLRRSHRESEQPLTRWEAITGTVMGAMLCVQSPTDAMVNAWEYLQESPGFEGCDDFQRMRLIEPFARGKRKVDAQFLHRAALILSPEQRTAMVDLLTRFIDASGAPPKGRAYEELVRKAFA